MTDTNNSHPDQTAPTLPGEYEEILAKIKNFWLEGLVPDSEHLIEAVRALCAIAATVSDSEAWSEIDHPRSDKAYLAVMEASTTLHEALNQLGIEPINLMF